MCSTEARSGSTSKIVQEIVVFLSLPRLHPSSNEKALLLRSVRWHTIQAHAEKGFRFRVGCVVSLPGISQALLVQQGLGILATADSDVQNIRTGQVTAEDFDVRIRLGRPFIIADAGRGIDLVGASCQHFHEHFPTAQMRAEYTGDDRPEKFISLGSKAWFSKDRHQAAKKRKKSSKAAHAQHATAPYVWHVKDGGHEAPPDVRAAVQRAWQPPYFLRGATNLREANESAEFWFHRRNGSVLAHADTCCIPAVSLQLTGCWLFEAGGTGLPRRLLPAWPTCE
ncbi:unnamed protein product [Symbiodinium sp. CCMP2592]|nr:unnamed protein product [Symbiodinium sp. CCMP2592]